MGTVRPKAQALAQWKPLESALNKSAARIFDLQFEAFSLADVAGGGRGTPNRLCFK